MLEKKMRKLPVPLAAFLRRAGALADRQGLRAYVVGGFVRDLFLGVENFDLDLVVEGDGIGFAQTLAEEEGCGVLVHRRFGTASLSGVSGFKVDIASARRETYEAPAALPSVTRGRIEDDLRRRDFTINAMAVRITEEGFGALLDLHGGEKDLKKRAVRALHPRSFIDDPTRILRAVRFEQRFGFRIEAGTLAWIREAVRQGMLLAVQKHRLRDELVLIFKERDPLRCLARLHTLSGFSFVASGLRFHRGWKKAFSASAASIGWFRKNFAHKRPPDSYVMAMALFFRGLERHQLRQTLRMFAFRKDESSRVVSFAEDFEAAVRYLTKRDLAPSAVYRTLEPLSYEVILLIHALSASRRCRERIAKFLSLYVGQRPHVRGEDLRLMGIEPGPLYTKILQELHRAKIDGKVRDKDEEMALVKKLLRVP